MNSPIEEHYVLMVKGPMGKGFLAQGTLLHCNQVYDMLEINGIWLEEYLANDGLRTVPGMAQGLGTHWKHWGDLDDSWPLFAGATLSRYDNVELYTADRTKKYWLEVPEGREEHKWIPGPTPAPWHPNPDEKCWQEVEGE